MARLRDWLDLGKSTFTSLTSDDVTNLYSLEWPETRKMLMAEHSASIEREPRRLRRWVRTVSAIFYGLAKRLAPHRRILFAIAFVFFFVCLLSLTSQMEQPPLWTLLEIAATFLLMVLLLAMELIDKLKYRDELQLARDLQASLIPHQMPRTEQWDIAAFNRIANTVGGDIYDFVPMPDGSLAVLFGDASGHGMAAGLVMAVAHAAFRTQLEVDPSPAAITASLNRILCRTGGSRSFFSCCYFLLQPDGTYLAMIAGHPPVLKIDAAGRVTERIGRGAYPLGVKANLTWQVTSGTLAPGERLLLHSDGLTEARNLQEKEFGDAYVEVVAGWHPDASAASLIESILGEWRTYIGSVVPDDDVSIAVIRRSGELRVASAEGGSAIGSSPS
ncbi:MAG TPA: PP2C family protein-serine/threonine phosphatase [Thermoanaerobaculia bacterium]|nr:PP2C family protein-serine/threonine phosphatase [Thermoanaerobaculia bacterium]